VNPLRVKYWEIVADNLSKGGWSWGCVSAVDTQGRTIWVADAHRRDGKRFVVRAGEKLTAFLELESAIQSGRTPRGFAEGVKQSSTNYRGLRKSLLDYVIRRFNASSAGLKKPVGLDLRLDRRFTRSPDPTGAPSQPK
jgi:hypothetical protein